MNQEGREMLAQGGYVDEPKPMGFRAGGIVPQGFGNQQPNPYQAQPEANPYQQPLVEEVKPVGANTPPPSVNNQPKNEVDAAKLDQMLPAITEEGAENRLTGKTDMKTVKSLSSILGKSGDVGEAIALLDEGIEKQESKRDSMRLLFGSLALLSGEGYEGAARAANQVGGFNAQRIDELYSQRKLIQDKITKDALGITGEEAKAKSGTSGGGVDLTATLQKEVRDLLDTSERGKLNSGRIDGLISNIESAGGLEGVGGTTAELYKGIVGAQGDVSLWKSNFTRLINSEVVNNLPPGVASDKDIELIKSGFPKNNWDKDTLVRWLQAYRKVTDYTSNRDAYRASHIEQTGNQTGWEQGFKDSYKPTTSASTANTSSGGEYDLDLSDL